MKLADCLSRNDLPILLTELGLLTAVVEIGVEKGWYSREILDRWPGQQLHLVDPWVYQEEGYQDGCNLPTEQQLGLMALCDKNLAAHAGRYTKHRMFSLDAAPLFEDGSLDMAYIDGNHAYRAVCQDLVAWYPKVRSGGIIAGHDYSDNLAPSYSVKLAVDEFVRQHQLELVLLNKTGDCSWACLKP